MMKYARLGAIALALAMPLGLQACGGKDEQAKAQPPRAVRVARIEVRPLNAGLTASGLLVSREEAAVASELAGYRVARVLADQGDTVAAGQPLVQLDDTLLRSQIEVQRVAAERAESEAERVKGLEGQGVLSDQDIDARRFQARSARASLNDLLVRQQRMTIRAPVSGVVLARAVRPGDLSGSVSGPMFRIARGGLIELDAEVPESQLSRLRAGQSATVTLPDGEQVTGTVRLVSPEVDQQTKLGRARISLPARRDLRPGGYARAAFTNLTQQSLVAPDRAVTFDADGAYVMVVDANNKVSRVSVRTGGRANGYVELLQGPPAGSRVLTSGSTFVLEGDTVSPTADTAPAKAAS